MSDQTWYRDGLNFECTQCGNCCTGSPGYVWVTENDIKNIAEFLDKPIGEIRLLYSRPARGKVSLNEHANGDCVFFDHQKRGCTIYPVRPIQCRTWPFWKANIDSEALWKNTQKSCPGAGTGNFVSLEEIEEQLAKTDL